MQCEKNDTDENSTPGRFAQHTTGQHWGARYAKLEPQDVTQPHKQQLFHTEQVQTVSGPPWGAPGSKNSTRKVLPSTGERVVRGGAWARQSQGPGWRAGGADGRGVGGGGVAGCSLGVLVGMYLAAIHGVGGCTTATQALKNRMAAYLWETALEV